jgi:hypothetical protein
MCLGVSSGPTTSGNLASDSASGAGTPRRMRKPAASRSGCALGSVGLPVDGGRRPRTPPESPPSSVYSPAARGGASTRSPRKPRSKPGRARSAAQARSGSRRTWTNAASAGSSISRWPAARRRLEQSVEREQTFERARGPHRDRPDDPDHPGSRRDGAARAPSPGLNASRPGRRPARPVRRGRDLGHDRGDCRASGGRTIGALEVLDRCARAACASTAVSPRATPTGQWWEEQPSVRQLARPQRGAELVRRLALLVLVITR